MRFKNKESKGPDKAEIIGFNERAGAPELKSRVQQDILRAERNIGELENTKLIGPGRHVRISLVILAEWKKLERLNEIESALKNHEPEDVKEYMRLYHQFYRKAPHKHSSISEWAKNIAASKFLYGASADIALLIGAARELRDKMRFWLGIKGETGVTGIRAYDSQRNRLKHYYREYIDLRSRVLHKNVIGITKLEKRTGYWETEKK
ncbi:MAG: hypothetical protein KGH49_01285 [Candidatus Micrarchaeota archaeon]|nr:hypothetical protein [Candidatus Micrarchaeota archaeon]